MDLRDQAKCILEFRVYKKSTSMWLWRMYAWRTHNIFLSATFLCKKDCKFNLKRTNIDYIFLLKNILILKKFNSKPYFMLYKIKKSIIVANANILSWTLIKWHQALAYTSKNMIWKIRWLIIVILVEHQKRQRKDACI